MNKVKLSSISKHITDGEHGSVHDVQSEYFLLANKNIVEGEVTINSNDRTISKYDFDHIMNRLRLQKNSILISTVGEVGKLAFISGERINYVFQRSVGIININENEANPYYIYLYLKTPSVQKYLHFRSKGSVQKCLFINDMKNLDIFLPNFDLQNKIVDCIRPIDKKIKNNKQINKELESLAKTIYDYWFLQFDFPNEEGKPYKSSGGAMIWNEELKREIPIGWSVHKLGNVTSLFLGGTPKTNFSTYWGGDINWLNSGEIAQFPITETELKITEEGMNNSATVLMKKGTVVVSITGNIRASVLAIDSCGNQSIIGINENDLLKKSYIYPMIMHLLDYFVTISTGNCQQHINKDTLNTTYIVIPPKEILDKYYNIVEPMFDYILSCGNESYYLKETRDFLLPLLMNGQVGFKDE